MAELGTKHECYSCGAKFYDFGRPAPICPKCGANQKDAKRPESAAEPSPAKRKRRDDLAKSAPQTDDDLVPSPDDDIPDDEIETPEGVVEEEEDFDDDEE
jgi:predicted  nucleic acid-binding Zn-ribbon protein